MPNCSLIYVTSDHRPRGPPPNCNASNDKFVTKTAIAFSVSALSLVFSPRPQTVKTFSWSSPDFREKFSSSAHDELFFFVWSSSKFGAKSCFGGKSSNYYLRFVYFHLLNCSFILFFYNNCARGAKIIFPF